MQRRRRPLQGELNAPYAYLADYAAAWKGFEPKGIDCALKSTEGGNKSEGFEFNQHGVYFIYGALLSAVGVGYFLRIGMDDEKKAKWK